MNRVKHSALLALSIASMAVFPLSQTVAQATEPVSQAAQGSNVQVIAVASSGFSWASSPDGETVAIFNSFILYNEAPDPALRAIRVIHLNDGSTLELGSEFDWATDGLFLEDDTLMTLHRTGEVRVWNTDTGELINTWQTPFIGGAQIQPAPDGERVLLNVPGGLANAIVLFNPETGFIEQSLVRRMDTFQELSSLTSQYPGRGDYSYTSVALSPDGEQVAAATQNDQIVLWSTSDPAGEQAITIRPASESYLQLAMLQLRFAPDGESLWVLNTTEKQLEHWSLSGERIEVAGENVINYALSPDGTQLAWLTQVGNEAPQVWIGAANGEDAHLLYTLPEGSRALRGTDHVRFTASGDALIVGGLALIRTPEANALYRITLP